MAILYNQQNVDARFANTLEANLYYGSIFVPGATFTDKYQIGPAGGIYVHKLSTNPCEVGAPGRDFTDEETADELIPILLNNNYLKSKKIRSVQAAAVGIALANENMQNATHEAREGWQKSMFACLAKESSVSKNTTAITVDNVKHEIIEARKELVKSKARGIDVVMCHPDFYSNVLEYAGKDFTPSMNDRINASGNVGNWLGFLFVEAALSADGSAKYYDYTGKLQTVDFSNVDFVMYNHNTLSGVTNFEAARLVDAENFIGVKAQVEINSGFRVTNSALSLVRKHTAG